MEDQRQALGRVHQETFRNQTRSHDLHLTDGLCSTWYHPRSHWISNTLKVLGGQYFWVPLLRLLLLPPDERNLNRRDPTHQGDPRIPSCHPWIQSLRLQSRQWKILRDPLQQGYHDLQTENQILWSGISSPERYSGAQDQVTHPSQMDTTTTHHQIISRFCKRHSMEFIFQGRFSEV